MDALFGAILQILALLLLTPITVSFFMIILFLENVSTQSAKASMLRNPTVIGAALLLGILEAMYFILMTAPMFTREQTFMDGFLDVFAYSIFYVIPLSIGLGLLPMEMRKRRGVVRLISVCALVTNVALVLFWVTLLVHEQYF